MADNVPSLPLRRPLVRARGYQPWFYFRFPLNLRMIEEMPAARGIIVSHKSVRQWARKFGQAFANEFADWRSKGCRASRSAHAGTAEDRVRFANPGPQLSVLLIMFYPANPCEHYFEGLAELTKDGRRSNPEALRALMKRFDQKPIYEPQRPPLAD